MDRERTNNGYQGMDKERITNQGERQPNPHEGEGERASRPGYGGGERRQGNSDGDRRPGYSEGDRRPNYSEGDRRPNYSEGDRRPNYSEGDRRPSYSEGDRRPNFSGGNIGRPGPGPNQRPPYGGNQNRPGPGGSRPGGPGASGSRPRPQPGGEPNRGEPREPKQPSEPKPVMKYTAEQLGDIESAYLRKQRDLKVPLTFTFLNGKTYTGVVTDFTPFTVHIQDMDTGQEVILRKLAMAYYRKADALTPPKNGSEGTTNGEGGV